MDDDLQKIRQARLQELQQAGGSAAGGGGGSLSSGGGDGDQKQQQEEETRKAILSQILTPAAADRLTRIAMVKQSRARDLETQLIMMGRSNQFRQRVTEEDLISIINMIDQARAKEEGGEQKIVFSRRKGGFDDDDDDLFKDL